ncbi:35832_t:CDS:2 [Racocetra persica]|uniref:35832_t:CDS:1 n=1 Tax=Racocetra persica TaxID=160502 RepID=A0ACA9KSH7_9GLOM|nr:35832_t:CDS:2 [Racocetra persica]
MLIANFGLSIHDTNTGPINHENHGPNAFVDPRALKDLSYKCWHDESEKHLEALAISKELDKITQETAVEYRLSGLALLNLRDTISLNVNRTVNMLKWKENCVAMAIGNCGLRRCPNYGTREYQVFPCSFEPPFATLNLTVPPESFFIGADILINGNVATNVDITKDDSFAFEMSIDKMSSGGGSIPICAKIECPTRECAIPFFGGEVENPTIYLLRSALNLKLHQIQQ